MVLLVHLGLLGGLATSWQEHWLLHRTGWVKMNTQISIILWHFWLFGVAHPGGGGTMVMVLIQMKLCQISHLVWPWVGTRYKAARLTSIENHDEI